jgi:hypothetical protein
VAIGILFIYNLQAKIKLLKILSASIFDFILPVTSFSMDDSAVDLGD